MTSGAVFASLPAVQPSVNETPEKPDDDGQVSAPSAAPAHAPAPAGRKRGGFREWFWASGAMAELRDRRRTEAASVAVFERRARLAAELGSSLLDQPEPVSSGTAEGAACELYRQSLYWSLLALDARRTGSSSSSSEAAATATATATVGTGPDDLRALWSRTAADAGVEAAILSAVEQDLVERSFVHFAELPADEQTLAARRLRRAATALVATASPTEKQIERVWNRRMLRLAIIAALAVTVVAAISLFGNFREKQRDIAINRPWRVSSTGVARCKSPEQSCGGSSDYFFHTAEEDRPWVELDLGSVRSIAGVIVENRKDCCGERATPLILEVSKDQDRFREITRRDAAFQTWKAEFAPVEARYVRLRANRRTMLHLASVRVLRP